jgi:hypothetical protein
MRSFTHTETAFLAWVYGQIIITPARDRFDMDAENLRHEWEELTGETLDEGFSEFVLSVHAVQ